MEESSLRCDSDMDSNETVLAVDEGDASGTLYEKVIFKRPLHSYEIPL